MVSMSILLEIRPLAGAVGAEATGIDLRAPLSDALLAQLRAAWLKHGVLFFRNQPLPPAAFQAFAEGSESSPVLRCFRWNEFKLGRNRARAAAAQG